MRSKWLKKSIQLKYLYQISSTHKFCLHYKLINSHSVHVSRKQYSFVTYTIRYVYTNLGGSFLHTLVSRSSAVIQEEGIFPMVVICLQDVPVICLIHPPHINSFLTRPGDHTALDKRNAFHKKIILLFRLNIYKTNDQIMKQMIFQH